MVPKSTGQFKCSSFVNLLIFKTPTIVICNLTFAGPQILIDGKTELYLFLQQHSKHFTYDASISKER